MKVPVRYFGGDFGYGSLNPDLSVQIGPEEIDTCMRIVGKIRTLSGVIIGVENETGFVKCPQ
jgi:hypothetical protein